MERISLIPQHTEIVINNGSTDGAVDIFSYTSDSEPAARTLGSLSVVGWRQADTSTMGYIVSLVAAMARREYYARPDSPPKEAFARSLHRINEVVDEFFTSNDAGLAIGIFAIAGNTLMVSKLDKFKILLSRNNEVIDILNNIGLFSKEHVERRQFSSIISGSLQPGDRLLAYYPSRKIIARERTIKTLLGSEPSHLMAEKLETLGRTHPEFSASFCRVDLSACTEPATQATVASPGNRPETAGSHRATLTWSPRQSSGSAAHYGASQESEEVSSEHAAAESEIPNIIPAEFSLGIRRHGVSSFLRSLRIIRMDTRGKVIALSVAALIIAGGTLAVRSMFFVSPQERQAQQLVDRLQGDIKQAQSAIDRHQSDDARRLLAQSLATINAAPELAGDKRKSALTATIVAALDSLDNAQSGTPSVIAQLDPQTDKVILATWSSTSQSLWAVTTDRDASSSVVEVRDGSIARRAPISSVHPDMLVGFGTGVVVIDIAARTITNVHNGVVAAPYTIPTQDTIVDVAAFNDNLYVLTDHTILKITNATTQKPTTATWLTSAADLSAQAEGMWIDGTIYVMSSDGILSSYYKGKRTESVQTPVRPSEHWRLIPAGSGTIAIACTDRGRVYVVSTTDGSLQRTIKLDSEQTPTLMNPGPDSSTLFVTSDNRIWKLN